MRKAAFIFIFLACWSGISAQVLKTVEYEISGRPTWQQLIPLGDKGVILFAKKDVTKAVIVKFDTELNKAWESEIFLDVEKQPTAFTFDNEQITFMFNEAQGMYYQVFSIALKDGKFDNRGFELREFFQDQDYVFFNDRILMAGINEKGAAFYKFDFNEDTGQFIPAELTGKANVQYLNYHAAGNAIESLWAIKEAGYTNEKKKKGEFIKDAYVVYAKYDTTGRLIIKNTIASNAGNFPLTATLTDVQAGIRFITGTYQSNSGAKGIYVSRLEEGKTTFTRFYDYRQLLKGIPAIDDATVKKIADNFVLLPIQPVFGGNTLTVGGTFFQANYQNVTSGSPYYGGYDPYPAYGRYGTYSNYPRTQSRQVFKGYNFLNGFVASFDTDGNLISQSRVDMNLVSPAIEQNLAVSENKSTVVCLKGSLAVSNLSEFARPETYKLSDETVDPKNAQFVAGYHGVRNWYGNYFIADGSRVKFEAIKELDLPKPENGKRKKRQQSLPQTNIRKIIYLSKVQ
ncbi:hypothetical protein [Emticicia sp. TH156]|uniref:hypothetical protein n=1 Tax=Emticicia sp. TH156 TaxID=2067454 RepID=UPI000C767DC5|nr:hypothetical protein [Emticicia sp. TH156]PLK43700.1 hypothetical protein C0V77_14385 [Emticicia sp. TH156]